MKDIDANLSWFIAEQRWSRVERRRNFRTIYWASVQTTLRRGRELVMQRSISSHLIDWFDKERLCARMVWESNERKRDRFNETKWKPIDSALPWICGKTSRISSGSLISVVTVIERGKLFIEESEGTCNWALRKSQKALNLTCFHPILSAFSSIIIDSDCNQIHLSNVQL